MSFEKGKKGLIKNRIPEKSGCYQIKNLVTGEFYIGSTQDLYHKRIRHWWELRHNTHHNNKLQKDWNKYGEGSFKFIPLFFCDIKNTLKYEQILLDNLNPYYNISPTAGTVKGTKQSKETRKKLSEIQKGKKLSKEHIAKRGITKIKNSLKYNKMYGIQANGKVLTVRFRGKYLGSFYNYKDARNKIMFEAKNYIKSLESYLC